MPAPGLTPVPPDHMRTYVRYGRMRPLPPLRALRRCRRRRALGGQALAIAPLPGAEQRVGEVSGAAEAHGVRRGMALGEALARCPELMLVPADPVGVEEPGRRRFARSSRSAPRSSRRARVSPTSIRARCVRCMAAIRGDRRRAARVSRGEWRAAPAARARPRGGRAPVRVGAAPDALLRAGGGAGRAARAARSCSRRAARRCAG